MSFATKRFVRHYAAMVAAMFLPTFAVIGLLWAGLVTDPMALMSLEHAAMLPSMLAATLLRRDEYGGRRHVAVAS